MRNFGKTLLSLGVAAGLLTMVAAQPPGGLPDRGGGDAKGKGGGKGKGGQRNAGPQDGGIHLIPPFARDNLNLSADQEKQIADLERDVRDRLAKILTADQMKQLSEARPQGRGGPGGQGGPGAGPGGGRGGPGGPGGKGRPGGPPPGGPDGPPPPRDPE